MDTENYERREARMQERKKARLLDNYTYYFGGLTEEEQQYRDYYETDLEDDPEYEAIEDAYDEEYLW